MENNQSNVPHIYSALVGVMRDLGAIAKTGRNSAQGFSFRGIDSVYNALQPALIKNGVIIIPEVTCIEYLERQNAKGTIVTLVRGQVRYRFCDSFDGSFIEAHVAAEALDQSDKATNKFLSIAFKYACFQVLCIPTEEAADPDADSIEPVNFSTPQEAINWASSILSISEEEATRLLSETPPDSSGKKATPFRNKVLALSKKK